MSDSLSSGPANAEYWDALCGEYQEANRISCDDFHYGPLLPGDRELGLLPALTAESRCLEIGSGAGQNSICIAKQGAQCQAMDISEGQLTHGRTLAEAEGVNVDFIAGDMDHWPDAIQGPYDLIHSTYALPFSDDPAALIARMTEALKPGGTLLITTAHPLFAFDWIEFDDDDQGLYVVDYFHPPVDARVQEDSDAMTRSRCFPMETMVGWFRDLPLRLTELREPKPLPIPTFNPDEINQRVPYYSEQWSALHHELERIPVVCILKAVRDG